MEQLLETPTPNSNSPSNLTREELFQMVQQILAVAPQRPLRLVFVRDGESEGNIANAALDFNDDSYFTEEFRNRHSSTWNLTQKGEQQAITAGLWIRENIQEGVFNRYYTSTYRRARRTAGLLGLPDAQWDVKDYIREHDWGNLDVMTDDERWEKYPDLMKHREINPYYFSSPGGESLAGVLFRVRSGIINTVYRELPNKTGIIVSHANVMWPVRMIIEGWTPEQYLARREEHRPEDKINNCQIFEYSRVHPLSSEISDRFNWFRTINPMDLNSEYNKWNYIEHKKYTNEELVNS